MSENFEIIDISQKTIDDIYNEEFRSMAYSNPDTGKLLDAAPSYAIIKLIQQYKCQIIVRETDYVDIHYRDEFSGFYSLVFKKHKETCTRLHFFKSLSQDELFSTEDKNFEQNYLGYCILRPTSAFRISRTLIKPPQNNKNYFILCKANQQLSLRGKSLTIEGVPFIQQDTQVGRCAQASLWMAIQYMHLKYGFPYCTPFQITEQATRFFTYTRAFPSDGLLGFQLSEVIRVMGGFPLYCDLPVDKDSSKIPVDNIKRYIYHYIESEIPVILGLKLPSGEKHAVVVVGHTFKSDIPVSHLTSKHFGKDMINKCYLSAQWIDNFIVNDDARGPYLIMPIEQGKPDSQVPYSLEDIESILIPLPPEVYMKGEDAELAAQSILNDIKELINQPDNIYSLIRDVSETNKYTALFQEALLNDGLVIRTYLKSSNDFKQMIRKGAAEENIIHKLSDIYSDKKMPKYIWVTEISTITDFKKENPEDRLTYGEIIIDPTASIYAPNWLVIHLPGIVLLKDPNEVGLERPAEILIDDKPRVHLTR